MTIDPPIGTGWWVFYLIFASLRITVRESNQNLSQYYHVTLRERSYATDTAPHLSLRGRCQGVGRCRGESRTSRLGDPSRSLPRVYRSA
jgi:hypothetical protein